MKVIEIVKKIISGFPKPKTEGEKKEYDQILRSASSIANAIDRMELGDEIHKKIQEILKAKVASLDILVPILSDIHHHLVKIRKETQQAKAENQAPATTQTQTKKAEGEKTNLSKKQGGFGKKFDEFFDKHKKLVIGLVGVLFILVAFIVYQINEIQTYNPQGTASESAQITQKPFDDLQQSLDSNQGQSQQPANSTQVPKQTLPGFPPPSNKEVQQMERQNPLNVKGEWVTSAINVLTIMSYIIALICFLDRREDAQTHDAWIAIIAALIIHYGWGAYKANIMPGIIQSKHITEQAIALLVQNTASWILICCTLLVFAVSVLGGRDLTPLGVYLQLVALLAVHTGNLGALGDAFSIKPSSTLVYASLYGAYSKLKMVELMEFTRWFLALNLLASICYLTEMFEVSSIRAFLFYHEGVEIKPRWASLVSIAVFFVSYIVFRIKITPDLEPQWVMLISLSLALLFGSIGRKPQAEVKAVGDNPKNLAVGFIQNPPWDGLLAALALGIFAIYFTGMV